MNNTIKAATYQSVLAEAKEAYPCYDIKLQLSTYLLILTGISYHANEEERRIDAVNKYRIGFQILELYTTRSN